MVCDGSCRKIEPRVSSTLQRAVCTPNNRPIQPLNGRENYYLRSLSNEYSTNEICGRFGKIMVVSEKLQRKCFVSQPSLLSAGIKELETELGITLFTRTNRGAYLTEERTRFLKSCRKILVQLIH